MLLPLLWVLQSTPPDTLEIHPVKYPPSVGAALDSVRHGPPQLELRTGQGTARVWLLRAADTFFVAATIPDSTPYWGDDFVVSMNVGGTPGAHPGHDDFQWYLRRVLDSTVIYRGRGGRWEAPRGDPDWRLGSARSGGGWEVSVRDDRKSWSLILRLDPAWLEGSEGRPPRLAFRIYDNSPGGWFAWPASAGVTPASVEQTPSLWGYVKSATARRKDRPLD
ncbi:MAG: hypothetical protein ACREMZ_07625 [Gemmatimonadales bacterium]